ncbi:MAG: hypothetical protein K2W79_05430 [Hydrotalea flava]|uniref:glycoside hydrolase family 28 protein n=1 Tax=Hydrotalea sp. AMD TaxID=2501297 RepID=UPI0009C18559|nr:glycosyl hydrolase family 28 protein [Hydrotalea sp. AMD]MBY0347683.1 hypothetical protein [Hydrotalea flava]RWZ87730.1 MAG: hypothetical protein EO766_10015 [Hydrotalea sp. AMD]
MYQSIVHFLKQNLLCAAMLFLSVTCVFAQQSIFNITDYGAVVNSKLPATKALQNAIDACSKSGGGTVFIPSGTFIIGTVHLQSHITLYLQSGSILKGSTHLSDYENFFPDTPFIPIHKGMFFTENKEDIIITGEGRIDGSGIFFFDTTKAKKLDSIATRFTRQKNNFRNIAEGVGDGPLVPNDRPYQMFVFSNCKRVSVKNIFITDAPFWCMHFADCDAVFVSGIRLWNNLLAPNADGIDVTSCTNVIINDCDIRTGDDAIAITGYNHHFEIPGFQHVKHISKNIIVSNCNLQSYSSGIRIGFLDQNTVKNIEVNNVNITNSTRGIGIFLRDEGSLENISFNNVFIETKLRTGDWWGNGEPIHISAVRGKANIQLGSIRHVFFNNIICAGENGILLYGSEESHLQDINFNHIRFKVVNSALNTVAGGNIDLRGCLRPREQLFQSDIPGILARYIEGLHINDFMLEWSKQLPSFFTNGLELHHFSNVSIFNFKASHAPNAINGYKIFAASGDGFVTDDLSGVKKVEVQ